MQWRLLCALSTLPFPALSDLEEICKEWGPRVLLSGMHPNVQSRLQRKGPGLEEEGRSGDEVWEKCLHGAATAININFY